MSFFLKGDQIWVLYSCLGQTYILDSFVRTVDELVKKKRYLIG